MEELGYPRLHGREQDLTGKVYGEEPSLNPLLACCRMLNHSRGPAREETERATKEIQRSQERRGGSARQDKEGRRRTEKDKIYGGDDDTASRKTDVLLFNDGRWNNVPASLQATLTSHYKRQTTDR